MLTRTLRYTPELAERLIADGQLPFCISLARAAAASGDPAALFDLGMWQLTGQVLERDLAAARRSLAAASRAGHRLALRILINLCANGSGQPADWPQALRLLELGASDDEGMAAELSLLRQMAIDASGFPVSVRAPSILCTAPRIEKIGGFLTAAECRHLIETSRDLLRPSMIADPVSGERTAHPIRRSATAVIGPMREDLVVAAINRRIAAATATRLAQGEPLNLLCYRARDEYRWHLDVLPGVRNQRFRTAILYLNDGYTGGRTAFRQPRLSFAGRAGDALIFDTLDPNGLADQAACHAGLPVVSGTKYVATRWLRQYPIDVWRPETLG